MSESKYSAKRRMESGKARKALMFELENLALDGHRLAYEAVKEVFKGKGIEVTPAVFSRFCLGHTPKVLATAVLGWAKKEKLSADKLAADVHAALVEKFSASNLKLDGALKRVLEAAAAKGVLLGAVSGLEKPVCDQLLATLGLKEMNVHALALPIEDKARVGADGWLRLARSLGVDSTRCIAMATTARSAKAALAAHMRCVAVPSAFTGFEDLGGADFIVDSVSDIRIESLLALVEPSW